MKSLAIALALALALPVAAKDKPFERPVQVRVDVSAEGRVVAADAVGDLPEALASIAEAAVKDVEFEPAQVNGQPASSRTTLDVKMRFTPEGEQADVPSAALSDAGGPARLRCARGDEDAAHCRRSGRRGTIRTA